MAMRVSCRWRMWLWRASAGFCLQGFQVGSDLGEGRLKILFASLREAFEQVGDAVAALVELADEVGAVCAVHFAAVCAERGDVAGQGVAGLRRLKPLCRLLPYFLGSLLMSEGCC